MDSKIILAILIVALIGIVAATYQDQTGSVLETLSNVAVEDNNPEGATDILESNVGSGSDGSVKVEEDVVKSDNTATNKANKNTNTKPASNTAKPTNNNNNPTNTNNTPINNNNNPTNTNNTPINNNNNPTNTNNTPINNNNNSNNTVKPTNNTTPSSNQTNTTTYKITPTQAKQIATENLPQSLSKAVASNPKLYGSSYEVTFYMNGKSVGYYEIDANTGRITGGAFEGEVPNP